MFSWFLKGSLAVFIVGCSPYADESRITRIDGNGGVTLPSRYPGKAKSQLMAGSSSQQVTAMNFKVGVHVGTTFNQSSVATNSNFKVYTSFNNRTAQ